MKCYPFICEVTNCGWISAVRYAAKHHETTPRPKQQQALQAYLWPTRHIRGDKVRRLCDFYCLFIKISVLHSNPNNTVITIFVRYMLPILVRDKNHPISHTELALTSLRCNVFYIYITGLWCTYKPSRSKKSSNISWNPYHKRLRTLEDLSVQTQYAISF